VTDYTADNSTEMHNVKSISTDSCTASS